MSCAAEKSPSSASTAGPPSARRRRRCGSTASTPRRSPAALRRRERSSALERSARTGARARRQLPRRRRADRPPGDPGQPPRARVVRADRRPHPRAVRCRFARRARGCSRGRGAPARQRRRAHVRRRLPLGARARRSDPPPRWPPLHRVRPSRPCRRARTRADVRHAHRPRVHGRTERTAAGKPSSDQAPLPGRSRTCRRPGRGGAALSAALGGGRDPRGASRSPSRPALGRSRPALR